MIRSSTIYNLKSLNNAYAVAQQFPDHAATYGEQLFRKYEPRFLEEVRYRPAQSKNGLNSGRPFEWSPDPRANARARAYFFAKYPNGYQRTGKWERGWVLRFDRSGNTFGFTLFGNGREKEFTSGFLNRTAPNRPIIGHARSGYIPIKKTVDFYTDAYRDEYAREFPKFISGLLGK